MNGSTYDAFPFSLAPQTVAEGNMVKSPHNNAVSENGPATDRIPYPEPLLCSSIAFLLRLSRGAFRVQP